jgi:hypothetical protein
VAGSEPVDASIARIAIHAARRCCLDRLDEPLVVGLFDPVRKDGELWYLRMRAKGSNAKSQQKSDRSGKQRMRSDGHRQCGQQCAYSGPIPAPLRCSKIMHVIVGARNMHAAENTGGVRGRVAADP